jgi:hypothetical protein
MQKEQLLLRWLIARTNLKLNIRHLSSFAITPMMTKHLFEGIFS